MAFSSPEENLKQLELFSGMTVVDLGAGVGSYTIPAAKLILPGGIVYAVEIQKDFLEAVRKLAEENNLPNVHIVWGDIEQANGVSLADAMADRIIIANVLFQARSTYTLALEVKRLLKPEGKVMVVDWLDSFGGIGPKPDEVIKPEEVKNVFGSAGLVWEKDFSAGEHHYGLIFGK